MKTFSAVRGGSKNPLKLPNGDIDMDSLAIYDDIQGPISYSDHHNTIASKMLFGADQLLKHSPIAAGKYGIIGNYDNTHGWHGELFDYAHFDDVKTIADLIAHPEWRNLPTVRPNPANGGAMYANWVFYHKHGPDGNWSENCQTQPANEIYIFGQNEKAIYELTVADGYVYTLS